MEDGILITRKEKLQVIEKKEHPKYGYRKYKVPNINEKSKTKVAFYEIPPNQSNYPLHYHIQDEETFYILKGKGVLKTNDAEIEVTEGDVIVCPPTKEGAHMLTNTQQDQELVYIEFDVSHYPEIIRYPLTNKVGIFDKEGEKQFFNNDSCVDYYSGEEIK